jgi:hypothetical protein
MEMKMKDGDDEPSEYAKLWRALVHAAKKGAAKAGYELERVPGRGLSNVWRARKDGNTKLVSIRTTRNRWIAYPPLENGKKWKTLDDVELVLVAALDSKESPQEVEVHLFRADEVRRRFDDAYAARVRVKLVVRDDFGMWINLDRDDRETASAVGSGIVTEQKPIAKYSLDSLLDETRSEQPGAESATDEGSQEPKLSTIAEVMAWARSRVADLAGVKVDAVKLDQRWNVERERTGASHAASEAVWLRSLAAPKPLAHFSIGFFCLLGHCAASRPLDWSLTDARAAPRYA